MRIFEVLRGYFFNDAVRGFGKMRPFLKERKNKIKKFHEHFTIEFTDGHPGNYGLQ